MTQILIDAIKRCMSEISCLQPHGTRDKNVSILQDMADIIADAEKAAAPVPSGWQSMDTAPNGGGAELVTDPKWVEPPRILIQFGDEAISVAYWDWYYAEGGNGCTDGFAWVEPCSAEQLNLHYTTPPTGWMPLPAAPQVPA